jgi:hypothetical protein
MTPALGKTMKIVVHGHPPGGNARHGDRLLDPCDLESNTHAI